MTLQEKDFTREKLVCVLKNHKTTISQIIVNIKEIGPFMCIH